MKIKTKNSISGSRFDNKTLKELSSKGRKILEFVKSNNLYAPLKKYSPKVKDGKVTYGEGYPITAFEKFLGYYDKSVNIANSPSISMVTDFSVARCFCRYVSESGKDAVFLDGESEEKYIKRAKKALDTFRVLNEIEGSFQFSIIRVKRYEKAKGLGESAAVAAATSRALLSNVFGDVAARDDAFVSRFARLVSGSGTRSATGGVSLWLSFPGINEEDCRGFRLPVNSKSLHFSVFPDFHRIQTMDAHGIASSSLFYPTWIRNKYDKILELLYSGLKMEDIMMHGQEDTFQLRSLLMSMGVIIDTEKSIKLISDIDEFRKDGGDIFLSADTGPSIVVMSNEKDELERFTATQKAKSLSGNIPNTVKYNATETETKKAEAFFNSL